MGYLLPGQIPQNRDKRVGNPRIHRPPLQDQTPSLRRAIRARIPKTPKKQKGNPLTLKPQVQHIDASLFPESDYFQESPEFQNDTTFDLNNISAIEIANDIQSNLNKTLTSMRGGQTSNLQKKRFVTAYQYANVRKFYHVSNFPRELTYP
jgi:hypothetical protein